MFVNFIFFVNFFFVNFFLSIYFIFLFSCFLNLKKINNQLFKVDQRHTYDSEAKSIASELCSGCVWNVITKGHQLRIQLQANRRECNAVVVVNVQRSWLTIFHFYQEAHFLQFDDFEAESKADPPDNPLTGSSPGHWLPTGRQSHLAGVSRRGFTSKEHYKLEKMCTA